MIDANSMTSCGNAWLAAARQESARLLADVAVRTAVLASSFHCVAAAGSLGRLEAGPGADLDTLFVVDSGDATSVATASGAVMSFFARLAGLPLKLPKPDGIFCRPVTRDDLLAADARGRVDESPRIFGPRIQMLLDARPIHGEAQFRMLRRAILDWYAVPPRLSIDAAWSYLVSDLIRYAHAYRNWQRLKLDGHGEDSWSLRQAKLHSCRFMTWLGLYALVFRAREEADGEGRGWLDDHLDLTPIERVAVVCRDDSPGLADEVVAIYATMIAMLAQPATRAALVQAAGPDPADATWDPPAALVEIVRLAGELRGRVTAWITARRRRLGRPEDVPF